MLAVLVVGLGLAALRDASAIWAGATFLLTCAVLTLAIVGVVCRDQSQRAWWLGFALFGWGYLVLAFWSSFELPTTALLGWLESRLKVAPPGGGGMQSVMLAGGFGGNAGPPPNPPFIQIGHCLLALLAALIGGLVSTLLFGRRRTRDERRESPAPVASQPPRSHWFWPAFLGLCGCARHRVSRLTRLARLKISLGILGRRNVLLDMRAARRDGPRRRSRSGKRPASLTRRALFGVGYVILAFGLSHDSETWPAIPTNYLLEAVRPWFPPVVSGFPTFAAGVASGNARILQTLEQPVPMPFNEETPLEDVLKHIKDATRSPGGQSIQMYVDPIGLQEADKTISSTIRGIDLQGVPLKTSLRLLLDQLDLAFVIRGGVLHITSKESMVTPVYHDHFLIVGHCLFALLAAGFGAIVAPLVPGKRPQPATQVADRPAAPATA